MANGTLDGNLYIQGGGDLRGQLAAGELPGGQVHVHDQRRPVRVVVGPHLGLVAGSGEQVTPECMDEPCLLGDRDELDGRHCAPLRVLPAG